MSLKGFPTDQKLQSSAVGMTMKHVTAQPSYDNRVGLDVVARFAFRVNNDAVPRVVEAGSTTQVINDTATPAKVGDFVRFQQGSANEYQEVAIVQVSANSFTLAANLPVAPSPGDEFFIMRYATQRVDDSGAQLVTLTPTPLTNIDFGMTAGAISNAAWTELHSGIADTCSEISLYNTTGKTMRLAVGGAGSEAQIALIPAGVLMTLKYIASVGTRFSVQAVESAASVGSVIANFVGEV